jgi:hypothetical protein
LRVEEIFSGLFWSVLNLNEYLFEVKRRSVNAVDLPLEVADKPNRQHGEIENHCREDHKLNEECMFLAEALYFKVGVESLDTVNVGASEGLDKRSQVGGKQDEESDLG